MIVALRRLPASLLAAVGQSHTLVTVVLVSLATLWGCRLPRLCLFDQCNADITRGPLAHRKLDLADPAGPFIAWPLARVCSATAWTPGLVYVCDNNSGGIGNIRGYILTCLRYAIDSGATGLVMPRIRTRSPKDLSDIMRDYQDFDYFFDADHFRASLRASCPQITIYDTTDHIPNAAQNPFRAEELTPKDLGRDRDACDKRELNRHTDRFGASFAKWLKETAEQFSLPPTSPNHPRVIRLRWGVQLEYPIYRDGPEMAATFGSLLKIRSDILELGKQVSSLMRTFAGVDGQDRSFHATQAGYAGMHLRTENDALSFWPSYDTQSSEYLRAAAERGFTAAYLATGNETEAAKLEAIAKSAHSMRVITKLGLLKDQPKQLAAFQALSWDQQALVDFLVLLDSDYFLGVSPSSFSVNIALKRHLKLEGLYTRPWKVGGEGDGRSWLVGNYDRYWDNWLYMYETVWP